MRLTCPNCDAQYEVDDRAIPPAGRDVQCSNCGHCWYFYPPGASPDDLAEEEDDEIAVGDADDADKAFDAPPAQAAGAAAPDAPPHGRRLDESVVSVLREEAELEAALRAAEGRGSRALEVQPDLGLAVPAPTRRASESETFDDGKAGEARRARREVLPDIEAINSSLGSSDPGAAMADGAAFDGPPRQRTGFGTGFRIVLLLVIFAMVVYVLSPQIVRLVPALAGPLGSYAAAIDDLRTAFYEKVRVTTGAPTLPSD